MKKILLIISLFIGFNSIAQTEATEKKIEWLSFEEAIARNEKEPKKFIIDVWTTWCGWCKKMDASTFTNPVIVDIISEHYYAVKLNAERKDTMILGGQQYVNEFPDRNRYPHQVAIALLDGKLSYPSIVYLDENVNKIQSIAGFQDAKGIEPILVFFAENEYQKTNWTEFQKNFQSKL